MDDTADKLYHYFAGEFGKITDDMCEKLPLNEDMVIVLTKLVEAKMWLSRVIMADCEERNKNVDSIQ